MGLFDSGKEEEEELLEEYLLFTEQEKHREEKKTEVRPGAGQGCLTVSALVFALLLLLLR